MGLKLEILLYLLASKVARMTGLCHQAFHFNDCVYVVKVCAQLCLLWRSEVNINVFLYLFFTLCLKDRLPTEHGAYNFSYNGWPASPRHLPVCLPGDGITYGHSAPLCTLNHLPSLLMLSFKLRLDTLTLVRLAAFQLWAV